MRGTIEHFRSEEEERTTAVTTLVTGGNGWLPSHVVRRLARAGETVVSYDLMEPDEVLRAFLGADITNVVFEPGDVTDRERLSQAATRHGVTSIVSAAAITPRVDRERREPERIIAVNLGGVVNALEVARSLPNFRRFVQISVVRGLRRRPRCHGARRGLAGQLDQPLWNHEVGRRASGAALWRSLRARRDRGATEQCLWTDGALHAGICRSD
jgi:NAD(P)-dependent dehydrogenase (short-subunit alcohol dehydrogenase family)